MEIISKQASKQRRKLTVPIKNNWDINTQRWHNKRGAGTRHFGKTQSLERLSAKSPINWITCTRAAFLYPKRPNLIINRWQTRENIMHFHEHRLIIWVEIFSPGDIWCPTDWISNVNLISQPQNCINHK